MPAITLPKKEDWPEELRDQASENEAGGFTLNVVPKAKLDEFRQTNIEVARERDDLKTKVTAFQGALGEDVDLEAFGTELSELRTTAQRVKDGELTAKTDIEKTVEERTRKMREDLEAQSRANAAKATAAEQRAAEAETRYRRSVLERAVYDAVLDEETGANPAALDYIVQDAAATFKFDEEGNMVPKQGEATLYGSDGATPMSMKEWVTEHVSKKTILAKPSGGGGTQTDPGKKFLGLPEETYRKMSPMEKLAASNKGSTTR